MKTDGYKALSEFSGTPMKLRLSITAALLALSAPAHAWFFFVPVGGIQNAIQGGHCVAKTAKVGERINIGGRIWVVKELNGESSRCSQYPNWPVIAKMEPYVSEEELAAEMPACLPMGTSAGTTVSMSGVGLVYVRSVSPIASDCSDTKLPVSARVVRAKYAEQPAASTSVSPQPATASSSTPSQGNLEARGTEPHSATASSKEQRSVTERLRELKQLRDENLITDAVYESKQKEILATQ